MSLFLSPIGNGAQFFSASGQPLNQGQLYSYQAGTTTPQATFTTPSGSVQNANPIILGVDGRPPQEIWQTGGQSYKYVLYDSLSNLIATYDNIAGINDTSPTNVSEWIPTNLTPTYISSTSFSLPGNQTSILAQYGRLKSINTGGIIYSTIASVVYTSLTTVTVTNDSGVLDSGLSAVSYGFLNPTNSSVPANLPQVTVENAANATNLVGSGTISNTTTGGGGLSVNQANSVTTTIDSAVVGTTKALGTSNTQIATTAFVNPGSSIAANGYRKYPDGLIEQWGTFTNGTNPTTVNFNITFANACFGVWLTPLTGGADYDSLSTSVPTTSSFVMYIGSGLYQHFWRALGH